MAERIADAASAYLRQHAHQPVDWWPFGAEPFDEARRRDVPVFLSIGYAACHWCHVMAAESFDDPDLADYLNAHFVAIKVDREERPDVDAAYMAATQTLTGQGGWPMSVFTLPDGRAFHAGTYFPPVPHGRQPSFRQVLEAVADAWQHRRPALEEQAAVLASHLGSLADAQQAMAGHAAVLTPPGSGEHPVPAETFAAAVDALAGLEHRTGGFSPAPKFPPSSALDFLLHQGMHDGDALDLAGRTLRAMALGALHDHVGGGFARYCVDDAWHLPHFEKMLYDNAQLLGQYARWATLAPGAGERELATRTAADTAQWLVDALLLPGGALASSLDADTLQPDGTHVEGGTYLFTEDELSAALGAGWPALRPLLELNDEHTLVFADVPDAAQWATWDRARQVLRRVRDARPQPLRDDKVVAAWNGLAIRSLVQAAAIEETSRLVDIASGVGGYLWAAHWEAGGGRRLARVSYQGVPGGAGRLEDHAAVVLGFQALGSATGERVWFDRARTLLTVARNVFLVDGHPVDDPEPESVLSAAWGGRRAVDPLDDAVPSGSALLAAALAAQSALDGDAGLQADAERLVAHVGRFGPRAPQALGTALAVAARLGQRGGPVSLAVAGGTPAERWACLRLAHASGATAVLAQGSVPAVSLLEGRLGGTGGPLRAYVCHGQTCRAPVGEVGAVERGLRAGGETPHDGPDESKWRPGRTIG